MGLWLLLGAAVLVAAFFPAPGVRAIAQVATGLVFVVCGLSTVALVVGAAVLESRGGGVMLLFAVVPGIAAWLSGHFFFASRRYGALRQQPAEVQRAATIGAFDDTLDAGRERLARLESERARFWTSRARRRQLEADIAHEEHMLRLLPALRPAIGDLANYQQETQAHGSERPGPQPRNSR